MATVKIPQNAQLLIATKKVDWDNDTFKLILCSNFTFNIDTDIEYADVSGNELANGFGYSTGGYTISGGSVAVDNTNNDARREFNDLTITASGGSIGAYQVALIYDDTVANDPIMASFTYAAPITISDGDSSVFENIIAKFKTPDSV
jgi:hypothetical protein